MSLTLHTLICPVSDMDRAVAFYANVLGLTPGHRSPYWSDFAMGSVRIGLHPRGDAMVPGTTGAGWVIGVATADLRALRAALVTAGVHVAPGYHDTPSGAVMDFRDPDGNALQAVQPGSRAGDLED